MLFGIRPLIEAIKAGQEVDKVIVQRGLKGDLFQEAMQLIRQRNIPIQTVPQEKLNRVTRKNHQGIIAWLSLVQYQPLEEVLTATYEKGETPFFLLLDRVTDVRNFGAIARSAECAGVHAIIVPTRGSAQINADAMKTSAGALMTLPVCRVDNLKIAIEYLKESGLQVVSVTEKSASNYASCNYQLPTLLIMGSEEDGISGEYLKRSDFRAKIPMMGTIESLNVSVAAGVLLFEVVKQRLNENF